MTTSNPTRSRSSVIVTEAAWQLVTIHVPHAAVIASTGISSSSIGRMVAVRNTLKKMFVPYHASVFTWLGAQAVASGLKSHDGVSNHGYS